MLVLALAFVSWPPGLHHWLCKHHPKARWCDSSLLLGSAGNPMVQIRNDTPEIQGCSTTYCANQQWSVAVRLRPAPSHTHTRTHARARARANRHTAPTISALDLWNATRQHRTR